MEGETERRERGKETREGNEGKRGEERRREGEKKGRRVEGRSREAEEGRREGRGVQNQHQSHHSYAIPTVKMSGFRFNILFAFFSFFLSLFLQVLSLFIFDFLFIHNFPSLLLSFSLSRRSLSPSSYHFFFFLLFIHLKPYQTISK